ncbi:exo-beta-N-acetylmuramidase NamZ family protein [Saccharibacillus endophyticus]|uniref:DUF1343 domain-containing protein n=1 Tax=Saccharibacillus endophyticus TaxID=2060666 RepID=A0ABQ1ZYZ3_9BACL|nr:DUF1343 domain-containing protein [Saccharibacillus endophyticus]GGH82172.1 hypothetical protein GCM10007362_33080 [Saccharibacillus endophyticus]
MNGHSANGNFAGRAADGNKSGNGKRPRVSTGLDRLAGGFAHPLLQNRRIGLITNPTGITADFRSSVEVCASSGGRLTALFAGEHGVYGQHQAGLRFGDELHPELGIPVFSLYGAHKKPTPSMLEHVDTLVFDMQDLGIRFYTYLSTLLYATQACAENGKALVVLDRPNPLGGLAVEGGLLKPGFESMVGAWELPIRTGMTVGELAVMANDLRGTGCELGVVKMEGWERPMEFGETDQPWMLPSPNMPSVDTVRVYAGTCFFEGTNLSEGRGTTRPFEWIGAPWVNGKELAAELNGFGLPGVHVHPAYNAPTFSKHAGELCGGVRLFVTEPETFRAVQTGLALLHVVARRYPSAFRWLEPPSGGRRFFVDLLAGGSELRQWIAEPSGSGFADISEAWSREAERWSERREAYLLY